VRNCILEAISTVYVGDATVFFLLHQFNLHVDVLKAALYLPAARRRIHIIDLSVYSQESGPAV